MSETTDLLREYGLHPRKSLGQNFLTDERVVDRIVAAAELAPDDTVIEIGPGLGVLTRRLLAAVPAGRLVAVELDRELAARLRDRLNQPQIEVVEADVLKTDPATLAHGLPYKLVANLPYYITSAVLRHFLEANQPPSHLVVMVQQEVAQRMVAVAPDGNLLGLSVQFYGQPQIVFSVPPSAFYPSPKVHSAVVRVAVYPQAERPLQVAAEDFFRLVRAGFGQKRKTLANSVSSGLGLAKPLVIAALAAAELNPNARAEELTLAQWGLLLAALGLSCSDYARSP